MYESDREPKMNISKDGSGQNSSDLEDQGKGDSLASSPSVSSNGPAVGGGSNTFPTNPVNLAEAKVSLHALPEGVKEGDVVSLKVSRIDSAKNCAYLSQDGEGGGSDTEDNEGGEKEGDEETTDGAVTPPTNEGGGIDSSLLTGPLSNLKNYLAQKSVDNQTRTYTK